MAKLNKDFVRALDVLKEKYGTDFETLNGLSEEQLSHNEFLDNFTKIKTVADASVDSSANVKQKDIVTLRGEISKPAEKLLAYHKIFIELKQTFGLRKAKKWLELEWNKSLYMHDANTASFLPYCFAYDLKRLAEEGLFWLTEESMNIKTAKHLTTFVDFVKEFISYNSNRTSGACGLPNLIPYMYYFWKQDIENKAYPRNKNPEQFAKSEVQRLIYAMNQPYCRDGIQSAFVNTSIFDSEYFDALFGGAVFPDGEFMIDHKDGIMLFQKWFMEEMYAIKERGNMFTFPVNTASLIKKDGKFADEEFARWICKHNMKWMDSNFFIDDTVTSLSNCCRLKSDIKDLGYFNSIGGTALKVGSIKVSTISLARIALEAKGEKGFLNILRDRVNINLDALHVVRNIIMKNVEKELLPNFQDGLMDFKYLYNTVGINGIYETMKTFNYTYKDEFGNTFYKEEAFNFGKKIFETIQEIIDEYKKDKDYQINVEQVPGEQAAVKFIQADKLLFDNSKIIEETIYSNNFYEFELNNNFFRISELEQLIAKDNENNEIKCTIKEILDNDYDISIEELNKYKVKK
jgi:anaerobic ribonucleoside-triphosphate reductase